ncbi:MAG TPA: hypothetical protein VFB13_15950 [Reyranella sp.]|jgi:hypothetical protein|nr:hypothetical protein [Reyranella sp.]
MAKNSTYRRSAIRTLVLASVLSGTWLSSAFAAEPARVNPVYSGWGSGLMTVSLIDSVKKEGPIRGQDPALAAATAPSLDYAKFQVAQNGH